MSSLDFNSISDLVRQAQEGNSNAFAELYAATYQKQYVFALDYLEDVFLAQDALQETYIYALNNISRLTEGTMAVTWITAQNFDICLRLKCAVKNCNPGTVTVKVDGKRYTMGQIMHLPASEELSVALRYHCGMTMKQIASLLEIRRSAVRRYVKSGSERLAQEGAIL